MADTTVPQAEDAAEKAYADAAKAAVVKAEQAPAESTPVEFPPKASRAHKPRQAAEMPAPGAEVVPVETPVAKLPAAPEPSIVPAAAIKDPAPKRIPAQRKQAKAPVIKRAAAKKKAAPTSAAKAKPVPINKTKLTQLKDTIMATKTTDFSDGLKGVIADVKDKAKTAFEKGSSAFGEVNEFSKGNVEALVESGKILAAGLQDMGASYVAESRSAFETLTADAKELATVKSPTDFFKLQSDLVRRSFDSAIAMGSKNSEAMMKLASEAFAPISGRVSVAVEKVKKAA